MSDDEGMLGIARSRRGENRVASLALGRVSTCGYELGGLGQELVDDLLHILEEEGRRSRTQ